MANNFLKINDDTPSATTWMYVQGEIVPAPTVAGAMLKSYETAPSSGIFKYEEMTPPTTTTLPSSPFYDPNSTTPEDPTSWQPGD